MREQLTVVELPILSLKKELDKAQLALEKLTGGLSRTRADCLAQVVAVGEALNAEIIRVGRLKRDIATEAKKRQQLLTQRWETSETGS